MLQLPLKIKSKPRSPPKRELEQTFTETNAQRSHEFFSCQERTHGELYKFKTMRDPKLVRIETDAIRLTKMGSFCKTSLDELPSIWNVIKGDMNLVGPRPLLPEYEKLYTAEQNKRHLVKPSLDGLKSMDGMQSAGRKSLNSMYGMSKIVVFI